MPLLLSVLLALVVALAGAPPAAAREQSPRCYPKGSGTVAASTRIRVFQRDNVDGDYWYYACDLLTGRRTILAQGTFRDGDSIRNVRFAGRVVAFEHASCPFTLNPTPCAHSITTVDVQTRARRYSGSEGTVTDLAVLPTGSVAWIESVETGQAKGYTVRRNGADGNAVTLDEGPLVAAGSLALARDATVYWTNAGVARSAPLDAGPPPAPKRGDPEPRGKRTCFPGASATYAADLRVRVYTSARRNGGDDMIYRTVACDLWSGRRTLVEEEKDDRSGHDQVVIAGRFLGLADRVCAGTTCGGGVVRVLDVRTGTWTTAPDQAAAGVHVPHLVIGSAGAFAWIREEATPSVRGCGQAGCRELDRGSGMAPRSLALAPDATLYWTRSATPRSVALQ